MIYNRFIRGEQSASQMEATSMDAPQTGEGAHIGKSVVIKGELSGSEDLYVDGNVEGKIEMRSHSLTVGPTESSRPT
jgi:cytoskeletal protein CcmA (bactofilin family)